MKILSVLNKKFEEWFLAASFLFMTFLVIAQIISRFVINYPIGWSEELARYILIWIAWISASFAVQKNAHIRVEFLKDKFSEKGRKLIELIVLIVWSAFAAFLAIVGTQLVVMIEKTNQVSPSLNVPMWIIYLAIPIGGTLMCIRLIQQAIHTLK